MKIRVNISQKALQVALGLFIGFLVLAQNTLSVQNQPVDQDAQEQSDQDQSEGKQVVTSQAVPFSTFQINLDFQSFLLEEVTFDEEKAENAGTKEILPAAQKALKILFRRIISPNAP